MPPTATKAELAVKRIEMGLDKPVLVQFAYWVKTTLSGDLGQSLQKRQPVAGLVADALPQTVELASSPC